MSAARILAAYRAAFVALILAASVQALLAGHEGGHNIVLLAAAEIVGAAASGAERLVTQRLCRVRTLRMSIFDSDALKLE